MNTNTTEIISETKAQDALDMISGHLVDPYWSMRYTFLTKEQKNTLIVNEIFKQFPRGFRTLPWILKNTVKEIVRNW